MKNNENKKICSLCVFPCCERLPGACYPQDIARRFPSKTLGESVKRALATGYYCIDWYEGENRLYFIRPATIDKIGVRVDPSWGGMCCFLVPMAGCQLPFEERPLGCQMLIPSETERCKSKIKINSKLDSGRKWRKKIDLSKFIKEE